MTDVARHEQEVDAWMAHAARGATSYRLVQLLDESVAAIWARSQRTLGDVTLEAVADRVVHHARSRFPVLRPLVVRPSGISGAEVRVGDQDAAQLHEATRFVLVELLTVLGTLTADVMTPALHQELRGVGSNGAGSRDGLDDALRVGKETSS